MKNHQKIADAAGKQYLPTAGCADGTDCPGPDAVRQTAAAENSPLPSGKNYMGDAEKKKVTGTAGTAAAGTKQTSGTVKAGTRKSGGGITLMNMKIQKQQPMRTVLIGLMPLCVAAVYLFGWRFLAVLAVVAAAGVVGEMLMARKYGLQMTESLFVSVVLFALSLPPAIPLWIAALGMLFGIVFGKMVFGGFGRNVFNPAISARAFVYISFGGPLTGNFIPPAAGNVSWLPGGFGHWLSPVDAISNATPLVTGSGELADMFFGIIPGSFGETSALLVLIGGIYIVWKKAANWRIVAASLASFTILQTIFWLAGAGDAYHPVYALLGGSFLLGAFFMITDPVSASQTTDPGRWIYGALFGILTVLIRNFSIWPAAITFAILLSNMFAPLIDYYLKEWKKKKQAAKKGASA